MSDHLCINESLDDRGLKFLVSAGLRKRFPTECGSWTHESTAVEAQCKKKRENELRKMKERLDKEQEGLTATIYEAVVDEVLKLYPYVLFLFLFLLLFYFIFLYPFSTVSSRSNHSRTPRKPSPVQVRASTYEENCIPSHCV